MTLATAAPSRTSFASLIAPPAEISLVYADALCKSIPAENFDKMPQRGEGRDVNSPAFNIGHLSMYPNNRLFPLIGREDLVRPLPYDMELFRAGVPCVDEPGKYPAKDVLLAAFNERYRAAIDALATVSDEIFVRPNPMEGRMRELFPTIGAVVTFLLVGHTQSHLGQISVWRRMYGLGSAF